jgi:hypothetical protein
VELPLTGETVIAKAAVEQPLMQTYHKRWQPSPWLLTEWAP